MTIFEDLKQALQSDISWDIKLGIESYHFDVVLETRVDDDNKLNSEYRKFCCSHGEPTMIVVRYAIADEKSYLPLNEMLDGEVLSVKTMETVIKIMKVIDEHKKEINSICGCLSGIEREFMSMGMKRSFEN